MTETDKLLDKVRQYSPEATVSDSRDTMGIRTSIIEIPCTVADKSTPLRLFIEQHDFEIVLGDLLSINKIENVEIVAEDVEALITGVLTAIKNEKAFVIRHSFLGRESYSLLVKDAAGGDSHTHYETLTEAAVKRFGKKAELGPLRFG